MDTYTRYTPIIQRAAMDVAGDGPPYLDGSLLMDFEQDLDEIKTMAEDRTVWSTIVNEL